MKITSSMCGALELVCGALEPRCGALKPGALEPWGAQTVIRNNTIVLNYPNILEWLLKST